MNVRKMRMLVDDGDVLVNMLMRATCIPLKCVCMLMVRVVRVHVAVFECLMDVFVLMALGQVQPYARSHQAGSQPEPWVSRLAKQG